MLDSGSNSFKKFLCVEYIFENPINDSIEKFKKFNNIEDHAICFSKKEIYKKILEKLDEGYHIIFMTSNTIALKSIDIDIKGVNLYINDNFFTLTPEKTTGIKISKEYCSKKIKDITRVYNYQFKTTKDIFTLYSEYYYGVESNYDIYIYMYLMSEIPIDFLEITKNLMLQRDSYRMQVEKRKNRRLSSKIIYLKSLGDFFRIKKHRILFQKQFFGKLIVLGRSDYLIENAKIYVDDIELKHLKIRNYYLFKFNYSDLDNETGNSYNFYVKNARGDISKLKNRKYNRYYNYNHIKASYRNKKYIYYTRNTISGNLIIQKKIVYYFEKSKFFHFKVFIGYLLSFFIKTNFVFFEKNISKFDESAAKVFEYKNWEKSYVAILKTAPDYQKLKQKYGKKVIHPGELRYYIYLFSSKYAVGTEVTGHLGTLRTNNKKLRTKLQRKKLIFLQHGIMMALSLNTPDRAFFKKNGLYNIYRIIVSSEQEKNHIKRYGYFSDQEVLNLGLPIFDNKEQNESNKDLITIMYTWRKWEEGMIDVTKSTYFKEMWELKRIAEKKYKGKVKILWHPKMSEYMGMETSENISEILDQTKVLITDYSSIAFDAFYRGSNVIFDFRYKDRNTSKLNNTLIYNKNMIFGDVFEDINSFEIILDQNYYSKQNSLYKNRYKFFNQYEDGKNTVRVAKMLDNFSYKNK